MLLLVAHCSDQSRLQICGAANDSVVPTITCYSLLFANSARPHVCSQEKATRRVCGHGEALTLCQALVSPLSLKRPGDRALMHLKARTSRPFRQIIKTQKPIRATYLSQLPFNICSRTFPIRLCIGCPFSRSNISFPAASMVWLPGTRELGQMGLSVLMKTLHDSSLKCTITMNDDKKQQIIISMWQQAIETIRPLEQQCS